MAQFFEDSAVSWLARFDSIDSKERPMPPGYLADLTAVQVKGNPFLSPLTFRKIARFVGSTFASSAIFCTCSSLKLSAVSFSLGVIIATAFFNCSSSPSLGATSIANSLLPLMSANRLRTILPYSLPANVVNFCRYCSIEIFGFTFVLFFLFLRFSFFFSSVVLFFAPPTSPR